MNYFSLLRRFYIKFVPESSIKNRIACFYLNKFWFKKKDIVVYYNNNCFFVNFNGFCIKFLDIVDVADLDTVDGYFKYYKLKEGDIVVDGGAFTGAFSIYSSRLIGFNGKVIAFEPDPSNYKRLLLNLRLNNITNVIALNKGIYCKNIKMKFNSEGSRSALLTFDYMKNTIIDVDVASLDCVLRDLNCSHIDFIKMDIEGSELDALNGAKDTLTGDVHLAIASYHIVNGNPTYVQLEKILRNHGFYVMTDNPSHTTTYASKINVFSAGKAIR